MSTGNWVSLAGMIVEGVGILLTGYGFVQTWREFSGERLIRDARPVVAATAAAGRTIATGEAFVRRLTGRPRPVHVAVGSAHLTGGGSVHARGIVGYPPLDPKLTTKKALSELDRRVRDVSTRLGAEQGRREDGDNEVRSALAVVEGKVAAVRGELGDQGKRIAVGGLRIAFTGLGLVLVGLVVQAFGVIVP